MKNPLLSTLVLVLISGLAWATPTTTAAGKSSTSAKTPKITVPKKTTTPKPNSKIVTQLPPPAWKNIDNLLDVTKAANKLLTLRYSVTPYLSQPPKAPNPKELAARFAKCGFRPWHLSDILNLNLVPSKVRDTEQFKVFQKNIKVVYAFQTPALDGGQPVISLVNIADKVTTRTFAPYEITINEAPPSTQAFQSTAKKGFKIQITSHPPSQDILTFAQNLVCKAPSSAGVTK